jgi:hypothetical protein
VVAILLPGRLEPGDEPTDEDHRAGFAFLLHAEAAVPTCVLQPAQVDVERVDPQAPGEVEPGGMECRLGRQGGLRRGGAHRAGAIVATVGAGAAGGRGERGDAEERCEDDEQRTTEHFHPRARCRWME